MNNPKSQIESRQSIWFESREHTENNFPHFVQRTIERLRSERILERIMERDHHVWHPEPDEIANRLGWLDCPSRIKDQIPEINAAVDDIRNAGFSQAILLGMGGSSLAPEVFRKVFGVQEGFLDLTVLDSTVPAAILELSAAVDWTQTLFIVSTKSGGTVETLSFLKYFFNAAIQQLGDKAPAHFVAITDPGSGLEALARTHHFRHIFINDPNIGGRFSALSLFGLVPAALLGVNLEELAFWSQQLTGFLDSPQHHQEILDFSGFIAAFTQEGRDKLKFIISPSLAPFGDWVEQLVAESTGKAGVGILPIIGETILEVENQDAVFVYMRDVDNPGFDADVNALHESSQPVIQIDLTTAFQLGAEFMRWELATAIIGHLLGINPFDQPNVESAKVLARKMIQEFQISGQLPLTAPNAETEEWIAFSTADITADADPILQFLAPETSANEGIYVAIQAFLPPAADLSDALQEFRTVIQKKYRIATTIGYGPRFLHSTGQLHKGDSGKGVFIQFTMDYCPDVPIPDDLISNDSTLSFGILAASQALGDYEALVDAGRKVIRLHLKTQPVSIIKGFTKALAE